MAIQFGVKEVLAEVGKYGFGILTGTGITLLGLLAWTGADDLEQIKSSVDTYVTQAETDVDSMAYDYQVLVENANTSIEGYQEALAEANENITKLVGAYTDTKTTLESTQATLDETQATLESTQNDLASKEVELKDLQTQLKDSYVSVDEVNEIIEKANAEIDQANKDVADAKDEVVNKTSGSNLKQIYEYGVAGAELIEITEDDLAVGQLPEDLQ